MANVLHRLGISAEPMRVFEAPSRASATGGPPRPMATPRKVASSSSAATGWRFFTPSQAS
jgi:hypothetical protein